jgi:hypothetical protein
MYFYLFLPDLYIMIPILRIFNRHLSTKKNINPNLINRYIKPERNPPKKHKYDIENEPWAKVKKGTRLKLTTYKLSSIKSERKEK